MAFVPYPYLLISATISVGSQLRLIDPSHCHSIWALSSMCWSWSIINSVSHWGSSATIICLLSAIGIVDHWVSWLVSTSFTADYAWWGLYDYELHYWPWMCWFLTMLNDGECLLLTIISHYWSLLLLSNHHQTIGVNYDFKANKTNILLIICLCPTVVAHFPSQIITRNSMIMYHFYWLCSRISCPLWTMFDYDYPSWAFVSID